MDTLARTDKSPLAGVGPSWVPSDLVPTVAERIWTQGPAHGLQRFGDPNDARRLLLICSYWWDTPSEGHFHDAGEIEHLRCAEDDDGLVSLAWQLSAWPQQALAMGMAADEATALVGDLCPRPQDGPTLYDPPADGRVRLVQEAIIPGTRPQISMRWVSDTQPERSVLVGVTPLLSPAHELHNDLVFGPQREPFGGRLVGRRDDTISWAQAGLHVSMDTRGLSDEEAAGIVRSFRPLLHRDWTQLTAAVAHHHATLPAASSAQVPLTGTPAPSITSTTGKVSHHDGGRANQAVTLTIDGITASRHVRTLAWSGHGRPDQPETSTSSLLTTTIPLAGATWLVGVCRGDLIDTVGTETRSTPGAAWVTTTTQRPDHADPWHLAIALPPGAMSCSLRTTERTGACSWEPLPIPLEPSTDN